MRLAPALLLLIAITPGLQAQAGHDHGPANSVPEQLGRVSFPTSCGAAAQTAFERGVALLHSFWYEEAAEAFHGAAAAEPGCAMAAWGEAMSQLHPLWTPPTPEATRTGLASAERAVRASRLGTHEREYAEAIAAYYREGDRVTHAERLRRYEAAMARLTAWHPRDEEAAIFHALSLIALGQLDAGDTAYTRQRRAAEVLVPLFRRHPDHPGLAHYLIHAYDSPALASNGVGAAERYAAIAPSVPHAQHMPSHIYVRVGRWSDAITSNLRSAESARAFERRVDSGAMWEQRAHAYDYLVYAYLQQGDQASARRLVEEVATVTRSFPENALITDYALAAIPARYALERNDWAAAETLSVRPTPSWRAAEALTHFARALGAARRGRAGPARAALDSLAAIEQALRRAGGAQAYWAGQVAIERMVASAWAAHAEGDITAALRLAREAADIEDVTEKHPVTPGALLPARELLADLLFDLGHPAEARDAYRAVLRRQPGRARSARGAALAAQALL